MEIEKSSLPRRKFLKFTFLSVVSLLLPSCASGEGIIPLEINEPISYGIKMLNIQAADYYAFFLRTANVFYRDRALGLVGPGTLTAQVIDFFESDKDLVLEGKVGVEFSEEELNMALRIIRKDSQIKIQLLDKTDYRGLGIIRLGGFQLRVNFSSLEDDFCYRAQVERRSLSVDETNKYIDTFIPDMKMIEVMAKDVVSIIDSHYASRQEAKASTGDGSESLVGEEVNISFLQGIFGVKGVEIIPSFRPKIPKAEIETDLVTWEGLTFRININEDLISWGKLTDLEKKLIIMHECIHVVQLILIGREAAALAINDPEELGSLDSMDSEDEKQIRQLYFMMLIQKERWRQQGREVMPYLVMNHYYHMLTPEQRSNMEHFESRTISYHYDEFVRIFGHYYLENDVDLIDLIRSSEFPDFVRAFDTIKSQGLGQRVFNLLRNLVRT